MTDNNRKKTMNKRTYNFSNDSCKKINDIMKFYNLKSETSAIEFAINECEKRITNNIELEKMLMAKLDLLQSEVNNLKSSLRKTEDYAYVMINVLNSVYRNDDVLWPYDGVPSPMFKKANNNLNLEKERQKEVFRNNLRNEGDL